MDFLLRILLWVVLCGAVPASAMKSFGLGIEVGDPTGITGKVVIDEGRGVDGAISWSGDLDLYTHLTYIWQHPKFAHLDKVPLYWHLGAGGRLIVRDKDGGRLGDDGEDELFLGPRFPVGLSVRFLGAKIEIFTEISATLELIPDMDLDLGLGLGVRYMF